MPQKPLLPSPRLLEGKRSIYSNKQLQHEKEHNKRMAQGSCCGPILWNIQYDTVFNLQFTDHTGLVAFADDLILMLRADSISEAENIANVEMGKITMWVENNKTKFNEEKSQVMLMTRRKRKEQKEMLVYINNKAIPQVQKLKYLGIIVDNKLLFREHINYVADKCKKTYFNWLKQPS